MLVVAQPTNSGTTPGLRAGSRFGNYRLIRLRGEGGFGQVWEAEDTVMDRIVAIKVLKPAYSDNPTFRQRLYREARTAGRLRDPHGCLFTRAARSMASCTSTCASSKELTCKHVLAQEGALGPARAVEIVRQVAAALDAAHANGADPPRCETGKRLTERR